MTVVKVIEVISEGKTIEEAIQRAVTEADKTLDSIVQVNVEHISGIVGKKGKIEKYRVNLKLSFVIEDKKR